VVEGGQGSDGIAEVCYLKIIGEAGFEEPLRALGGEPPEIIRESGIEGHDDAGQHREKQSSGFEYSLQVGDQRVGVRYAGVENTHDTALALGGYLRE